LTECASQTNFHRQISLVLEKTANELIILPRMDLLARIKRCALLGQVRFTLKAAAERVADDLTELEICESLVNATRIEKRLRSTSSFRASSRDYLCVITAPTAAGILVYTKGRLVVDGNVETYYLLVSAKVAE